MREEGGTDGVRQMPVQLLTKCACRNHNKPQLINDQRFSTAPRFTFHTPFALFNSLYTPSPPPPHPLALSSSSPSSLLTNVSSLHGPQTHTAVCGGCHNQSLVLCEINGHNTIEVCTPCHQERGWGSDWLGVCHTHTVVTDGPQLQYITGRTSIQYRYHWYLCPRLSPSTSLSSSLRLLLTECIQSYLIQMVQHHLLKS